MVRTSISLMVPAGVMVAPAAPLLTANGKIDTVLVAVRPEPETTVCTNHTVVPPGRIELTSPVMAELLHFAPEPVSPIAVSSEEGDDAVLVLEGTSA